MKNFFKRCLVVILGMTLVFGLTACSSDKSEIKDTVSEFEYACENLDSSAILKIIDPKISDPIRLGMALFSTFSGTDYEDVIDLIFSGLSSEFGVNFNAKEFLSSLSITDLKVTIDKEDKSIATGTCKINCEIAGESFTKDANISFVKSDEKWYISGIKIIR